MKKLTLTFLLLAAVYAVGAAEPVLKISVLDNAILCVRATHVPQNVPEQLRAASIPSHLNGTVLDLRFADEAATNASDYFVHKKLPLVVLVNSQTRGPAAELAAELRKSAAAIVIGSTNSSQSLAPDILVSVDAEDERKFQEDPYFNPAGLSSRLSATNDLIAFVDHTSEADLVRKRIKDGQDDASPALPRPAPPQPVVRDPALARAMDLLKALAVLNSSRG